MTCLPLSPAAGPIRTHGYRRLSEPPAPELLHHQEEEPVPGWVTAGHPASKGWEIRGPYEQFLQPFSTPAW